MTVADPTFEGHAVYVWWHTKVLLYLSPSKHVYQERVYLADGELFQCLI
jgi:hypothetical protein